MLASSCDRRLTCIKTVRDGQPKIEGVLTEEIIMTQPTRTTPAQSGNPVVNLVGTWPVALTDACLRMQRLQWDALAAWQRSFATFNEDFWEQWACRYAGGLPIDA
jgi:hypothetical protein